MGTYKYDAERRGKLRGCITGYQGVFGPIAVTYDDILLNTTVDGPHVPPGWIEAGPDLAHNYDFKRAKSVAVAGGIGNDEFVARLGNRRPGAREPLEITAADWTYSVRRVGFLGNPILVRGDGTELNRRPDFMVALGLVQGKSWAVEVDRRDVVMATLLWSSRLTVYAWNEPWWALF